MNQTAILEITTISEIETATETTPKVEIETNSTSIWGLPSSGLMQYLTTNLLFFTILIPINFLRYL